LDVDDGDYVKTHRLGILGSATHREAAIDKKSMQRYIPQVIGGDVPAVVLLVVLAREWGRGTRRALRVYTRSPVYYRYMKDIGLRDSICVCCVL